MKRVKAGSIVIVLVAIVASMFSCAKQAESLTEGAIQESFEAWLKRYDPLAEKKESGIYMRFIERGDVGFIKPRADTSWFLMNYTIYTMSGVIAETRSELQSRLIGQWVATTHWTDDLVRYYSNFREGYNKVCPGLRESFQYLREGDSVRIYIPSSLAYSGSMHENNGYIGEASNSYVNRPVYFDIRVKELINDPMQWELRRVQDYVFKEWGQLPKDSIANGVFIRLLGDVAGGDSIKKDSTVKTFFATRFMDNHLQLTNVKRISQKNGFYGQEGIADWAYSVKYYTSTDFDNMIGGRDSTSSVFLKAFLNMKTGQTVEVVATSNWHYGNLGKANQIPQILPYQPLNYKIRVLKRGEKEDEDDIDLSLLY